MKAKVVYYTKSGNTKKVASAIGEALNCQVSTVDTPISEKVEVLFLGASVYKFGIDKKVLQFIDGLDAKKIGKVVIFSTSAMADSGYPKLVKKLKDKGIAVSEAHYYCKGAFMMMNKNHPNQADVNEAKAFAKQIVASQGK